MFDRLRERPVLTAFLLGLAAQILFLVHLGHPAVLMFDEQHYVPAARVLLSLDHPVNREHPLLAKEIIAAGIALFGDNPLGWRLFSTLSGAATVACVYAILFQLCREWSTAVTGALLTIFNQMVFVQARIAMLDGFLGLFLTAGVAAMLWAMRGPDSGSVKRRLALTGLLLGLGVAVKWAAVPYVACAGAALLFLRARDVHRAGRPWRDAVSAQRQRLWTDTHAITALLIVGLVSIATYFATFAPAFFYAHDAMTFAQLIPFQFEMWALQTQILPAHPYQSDWWSWPLILRPIWYFYAPDNGAWRGVLLIGNPAILWGGIVAVAACLIRWWRSGNGPALGAAGLWIGSLAIWAIIPKSLGFFYYYYPSAIFLSIALALALRPLAGKRGRRFRTGFMLLSAALFVYFYPILSAMPLNGERAFTRWIWFRGWI